MRTLLRHTTTQLYLQAPDRWTPNPDGAVDFRFIDRAIEFVKTWQLAGVELAFVLESPRQIMALPLEQAVLRKGG